jgi:SSS family solute:Na+ symporter
LDLIDGAILLIYFSFVLGIGFVLKRTSNDFFLSGRMIPTWVAG